MTKSFLKGRHSSKWMIDEKTDIEQKQNVKNVKRKLYRKYTFEKLMSTLKHHVRTHTQQMFYEEIYRQNELLKYATAWFCGFVNLCIEKLCRRKRKR